MLSKLREGLRQLSRKRRGFRFSEIDLMAIVICGVLTWVSLPFLDQFALIFPITLGHFFLFCNVFRIHRKLELIWAGAFVINVASNSLAEEFSWIRVLILQTPLTLLLIAMELRSGRYHGIFCGREDGISTR